MSRSHRLDDTLIFREKGSGGCKSISHSSNTVDLSITITGKVK